MTDIYTKFRKVAQCAISSDVVHIQWISSDVVHIQWISSDVVHIQWISSDVVHIQWISSDVVHIEESRENMSTGLIQATQVEEQSRVTDLGRKWVILATHSSNPGLFQIQFHYI